MERLSIRFCVCVWTVGKWNKYLCGLIAGIVLLVTWMDVIFVYIYQVIYINVHIKVEKQLPGKLY